MTSTPATRTEHDAIGEYQVPADAYYGIDTKRAVDNFPVSGILMPKTFIYAHTVIKRSAALANKDLGLVSEERADAIVKAADEVLAGKFDDQFVVEVFQTGSGTSTNMNVNEVLANRANEILGKGPLGHYDPVHPNDHVNRGQSSNDTIPTSLHLSVLIAIEKQLVPVLEKLEAALRAKATEFDSVVKTGRTHLMDATPIRMGQEFLGYAGQIERGRRRVSAAADALREVALGGTAVGTGVNTHPEFAARTLKYVSEYYGVEVRETTNHFQAQSTIDAVVEASGQMKTLAVSLVKMANDIRLMGSGPRASLFELQLPALQPGSSIMPGKVNPVIPEAVVQVAAQVVGNDATIAMAGQWGFFELNTMLPVAAYNMLQSVEILANVCTLLDEKCVSGLIATENGPRMVEFGLSIATPLANVIGYDRTAEMANKAFRTGQSIREIALEETDLTADQLTEILDARKMTGK
jgi:fumarate hydratase, class II